jgi:hypothetical protein
MKKMSLLIALTLLPCGVALQPSIANAQDDKQGEFERAWYDTCYTKKDTEKCYQQSKELVAQFPKSTYGPSALKNIKAYEKAKCLEKFQNALSAYSSSNPPDPVKLDQIFAVCDECRDKVEPAVQQYFIGRAALAGANGAMGEFYKNLDKIKGYAETALKTFEPVAPLEGWKKEEWDPLREIVLAQMNQYMGWHYIVGTKGDQNMGLDYLSKAIQVKGRDGAGWKDPNNYYLRSTVYYAQYSQIRKPYDEMPEEQRGADSGKEILKKVNELLDSKLIPEYARILATATKPETKSLYDFAKPEFDKLWEFRTGAKDKAPDYIKNYTADPTIASVPIPAKTEDTGVMTPADPTGGPGGVKVTTSSAAGADNAKAAGNGAKAAPAGKGGKRPATRSRKRGA